MGMNDTLQKIYLQLFFKTCPHLLCPYKESPNTVSHQQHSIGTIGGPKLKLVFRQGEPDITINLHFSINSTSFPHCTFCFLKTWCTTIAPSLHHSTQPPFYHWRSPHFCPRQIPTYINVLHRCTLDQNDLTLFHNHKSLTQLSNFSAKCSQLTTFMSPGFHILTQLLHGCG